MKAVRQGFKASEHGQLLALFKYSDNIGTVAEVLVFPRELFTDQVSEMYISVDARSARVP
jgi:hypothetical protein